MGYTVSQFLVQFFNNNFRKKVIEHGYNLLVHMEKVYMEIGMHIQMGIVSTWISGLTG